MLRKILLALSIRAAQLGHRAHHAVHQGHNVMHFAYLGAVSYEAHGWYGKAAMGLLVFTAAAHLIGEPVE